MSVGMLQAPEGSGFADPSGSAVDAMGLSAAGTGDQDVDRFAALIGADSRQAIRNVQTQLLSIDVDGHRMPITVNSRETGNSYVVSPLNAYGAYAREELTVLQDKMPTWPLGLLIRGVEAALSAARIDQIVYVNNWLFSTNPYPAWQGEGLEALTETLADRYPEHFIAFRSLNSFANDALLQRFKAARYRIVPARQIYMFDHQDLSWLKCQNTKRDLALLKKTPLTRTGHDGIADAEFEVVEALYAQLYLQKYSYNNPQFSAAYLRQCRNSGVLEFEGFRDAEGRLVAVVGTFQHGGVLTTPMLGYDTTLPRELGLYRLLIATVFEKALERGIPINLSAGAASFKRLRGAKPFIEYTAQYDQHLSWSRRATLNSLTAVLTRAGVPLMKRFKL